jgi:RHS repeat-associated protein
VLGGAQIHELGPIIVTRQGGTDKVTTALRDRLGSTIDTIDSGLPGFGNTRTYDAFGAVRNGDMTARTGGTLNLGDTIHGFTKHDHADEVQLIHMGGRIYDYNLGRFLQVDPIIGNPMHSQSLNPYSYVGNNPLSGTDPTGYVCTPATGTNVCGYAPAGSNGQSVEERSITDEKTGQVTKFTQTVTASGIVEFIQTGSSGARDGATTKPANALDGSKNGASGIDGQEHDPAQQQLQAAAAFGKKFAEVGGEVINPCPGSTTAGGCAATVAATAAAGPVLGKVTGVAKSGFAKLEAEVVADLAAKEAAANESAKVIRQGATNGETQATALGREIHKTFDYGEGFRREFTLPSGKRVDAINFETREILELKPNNSRQIRAGERQLEQYRQEAQREFGGTWTARVVTYDK